MCTSACTQKKSGTSLWGKKSLPYIFIKINFIELRIKDYCSFENSCNIKSKKIAFSLGFIFAVRIQLVFCSLN